MFDAAVLRATLGRIDGRPFAAYRDLVGSYRLPDMVLHIDRVQPDPFAPPSRLRVTMPAAEAGFTDVALSDRVPLLDFLLRSFAAAAAGVPDLRLPPIGPEVLERSALAWQGEDLELRFGVDLPADGHRVLGRQAMALLLRAVPEAALGSLRRAALDGRKLRAHLEAHADDRRLREILAERGWVAFIADGSILPRLRGGSDAPLPASRAVAFAAPEPMAATVELPHAGSVRGIAIPRGVTLIVGGGYHGKSTLLAAIAAGVYPHVPGDGRERVVTVADAVAVRVDEGRPVTGVDVSAFVQGAPGVAPGPFTSAAASGSTSQAAGVAEALEMGCTCLLIDEDTSAANFMARDARMQALVPPAEEPIVPLCDRLQELARQGVSTVLVAGGHGAFLAVADRVVRMHDFRPDDVSERSRQVVAALPDGRVGEAEAPWRAPSARVPLPEGFAPSVRVRPRGRAAIAWDEETMDLSALPQLVDEGQTRAIADLLQLIGARYVDGRRSVAAVIAEAFAEIDRAGLAVISPWRGQSPGEYARPRPFEVAAALNRLPSLAVAGAAPQATAAAAAGARGRGRGPSAAGSEPRDRAGQAGERRGARNGWDRGDRPVRGLGDRRSPGPDGDSRAGRPPAQPDRGAWSRNAPAIGGGRRERGAWDRGAVPAREGNASRDGGAVRGRGPSDHGASASGGGRDGRLPLGRGAPPSGGGVRGRVPSDSDVTQAGALRSRGPSDRGVGPTGGGPRSHGPSDRDATPTGGLRSRVPSDRDVTPTTGARRGRGPSERDVTSTGGSLRSRGPSGRDPAPTGGALRGRGPSAPLPSSPAGDRRLEEARPAGGGAATPRGGLRAGAGVGRTAAGGRNREDSPTSGGPRATALRADGAADRPSDPAASRPSDPGAAGGPSDPAASRPSDPGAAGGPTDPGAASRPSDPGAAGGPTDPGAASRAPDPGAAGGPPTPGARRGTAPRRVAAEDAPALRARPTGTGTAPAAGPDTRPTPGAPKAAKRGARRASGPSAASATGKPPARAAGGEGPVPNPSQSARGRERRGPEAQ